ncbi:cytochrome-c peroxidase [Litorisediminicola beolgyonensis]|uniref:Cytochrome-c peroxidase n=1 Tax=Litorisediminicola beolgyonensis TaxID=1173614 RepID=A0ABW3ZEW6_9RHOB
MIRRGLAMIAAGLALAGGGPVPLDPEDFMAVAPAEAELGQLLFYDAVLSGNRNISCATCHHPRFATSDGVSLGLGEGGTGLGPDRVGLAENMPEQRIPRNSPALFNMGHRGVTVLFHDGRIEVDPSRPSGLRTPMEEEMVAGFTSLLSAQTMFPVLSGDEMAGHYGENEVARAVRMGRITGEDGAWDLISRRVADLPAYAERFAAVYPEIAAGRPIGFTDISNAIAGFVAWEWRSEDSLFDRSLRGEAELPALAAVGRDLFFGEAGCAACHSGALLSDMQFHATGEAQIGPGKAERFENHQRDLGRGRVTGRDADMYRFRTPMLRNVTRTGPWGHAGAVDDLRAYLAAHAARVSDAPRPRLPEFAPSKPDFAIWESAEDRDAIAAAAEPGRALSEAELGALMAFLDTLSDEVALEGRLRIPESVPSGLPVDR